MTVTESATYRRREKMTQSSYSRSLTQSIDAVTSPRQLLSRSWCCISARFDPRDSQPSRIVTQTAPQTTAGAAGFAFGGSRSVAPCSVSAASERGCGNIGKRSDLFVTLLCHLFTQRACSTGHNGPTRRHGTSIGAGARPRASVSREDT